MWFAIGFVGENWGRGRNWARTETVLMRYWLRLFSRGKRYWCGTDVVRMWYWSGTDPVLLRNILNSQVKHIKRKYNSKIEKKLCCWGEQRQEYIHEKSKKMPHYNLRFAFNKGFSQSKGLLNNFQKIISSVKDKKRGGYSW